jgi:integrase/recombinase XerD
VEAVLDPIERFISALWIEEGLSGNTLSAYRRDLRLLTDWLQESHGADLPQATGALISEYAFARHEQSKASSANRRLSVFKRYFRWALRERIIESDPTLKLMSARQPMWSRRP